jgi:hypothetical protein
MWVTTQVVQYGNATVTGVPFWPQLAAYAEKPIRLVRITGPSSTLQ